MSSIVYVVGAVVIIGVALKMLGVYQGAGRFRQALRGSGPGCRSRGPSPAA